MKEVVQYKPEVSRLPQKELAPRLARLGFEGITAQCLGLDPSQMPAIIGTRNFINGDPQVGLVPSPKDDAYLAGLVISTLGDDAVALSFPPMPGLLELYTRQGIIFKPADAFRRENLITVEPDVIEVDGNIMGNPHLNPVALAVAQGKIVDGNHALVATFPTDEAKAHARQIGLNPIQETEQGKANKVSLHTNAKEYGIPMFDSYVLDKNIDQLNDVVAELAQNGVKSVWLKIDNTSGGDGVRKYTGPMTYEGITKFLAEIRGNFEATMHLSEYENVKSIEDFWPSDMGIPKDGLIIERDGQDQFPGKKVRICSNAMEVRQNGQVVVHGDFEQLFEPGANGAYLGSKPTTFDAETTARLDKINGDIARLAAEKFNFAGVMGVDYVVIEDENGHVEDIRVLEGNFRDPISFSANTAAAKVAEAQGTESYSFINTNLTFEVNITSMEDLRSVTTLADGTCLLDGTPETGMVVPLATRSLFHEDGSVAYESPVVKFIVMGANEDHCLSILGSLRNNKKNE
jgi:hypothetical protein